MRKILIILLFLISLGAYGQTTWYVDVAGDDSGDGSAYQPWLTLYKACTDNGVSDGDIIRMGVGSFVESHQCRLPDGVSLLGMGKFRTTIHLRYVTGSPCLLLESAGMWGNVAYGNQTISDIGFNGDMVGLQPIAVNFRSNVTIQNCLFIDFVERGVSFYGCSQRTTINPFVPNTTKSYYRMPDYFCTGNKFLNNTVTNCSRWTGALYNGNGAGNLQVGAQDGMVIQGNTITQTGRAALANGYGIKFHDEGFNKNTTITENTITVGLLQQTVCYEFAIEWWNSLGGDKIYKNRVFGSIDLVNAADGISAGYSVRIYDNEIGRNSSPSSQERGILLEGRVEYCEVYRNYIHHVARAIYIPRQNSPQYSGYDRLFHVKIYDNLMVKLGQTGSDYQSWGIQFLTDMAAQAETQYFYIQNNVIEAIDNLGRLTMSGIILPEVTLMSYIYIENNIILNWDYHAIWGDGSRTKAENIYIRNNLMYNNGSSNAPVYVNGFPTGSITYVAVTPANPLFVGANDYQLQALSPAVGKGIYTGLTTDIINKPWMNPPSIGAYEYGIPIGPPIEPPVYPEGILKHNGRWIKHNGRLIKIG